MMKKSSFTALLLGTLSGVLFAIGMCMALIAEWNAFTPGVVLGCTGVVLGIATMLIWRKICPAGMYGPFFWVLPAQCCWVWACAFAWYGKGCCRGCS